MVIPWFSIVILMIISLLQGLPPKTTSKCIVLACWKCMFGLGVGRMHVENACQLMLARVFLGLLVTKAQSRQQALASAHASTHAFTHAFLNSRGGTPKSIKNLGKMHVFCMFVVFFEVLGPNMQKPCIFSRFFTTFGIWRKAHQNACFLHVFCMFFACWTQEMA